MQNNTEDQIDAAVVLAGGEGWHLDPEDSNPQSKPLTPCAGVSLLLRNLIRLGRGGTRRVVVVTGFRAEEVRRAVEAEPRLRGMQILFAHNPDWK